MTYKDYELEYLLQAIAAISGEKSVEHWVLDMALRQEEARPTSTGDAMAFLLQVRTVVTDLINEAQIQASFQEAQERNRVATLV